LVLARCDIRPKGQWPVATYHIRAVAGNNRKRPHTVARGIAQPVQQFLFGHVIIDVEIIRQLIYGLALILIMLYRPGGIWQKSGAK
jgi:ABC-type branched-subunit amino acid transport system permease subunit